MAGSAPPVLCLIGPTASGKSSLAMDLARSRHCGTIEIVNMDSAMVYRGLDIGTAKPSRQEQSEVRQHLIDLVEPTERYSVAQFLTDARKAIDDIRARGHTPVVVGGTMLYFKALREGLDLLPSCPDHIRVEIEGQARQEGWPVLHAQLTKVDPQTAARLAPNDAQRICRALEVWHHTGQTLSSWIAQSQSQPGDRLAGLCLRVAALMPSDRAWLHARIEQRFRLMLEHGFLQEVAGLMRHEGLSAHHPSMRCVGYRQAWAHLSGEIDREALLRKGIEATRQLAKRQITWLRSFPGLSALEPRGARWDQLITVWGSSP